MELERQVAEIVDRAFDEYRQMEKNRMPPWSKIELRLSKELEPVLREIRDNALTELVREFGDLEQVLEAEGDTQEKKGILKGVARFFGGLGKRVKQLAKDIAATSRRRWRALTRPFKKKEVEKWRDQNLGKRRVELIAATEVTMAHSDGEMKAVEYLARTQGILLEGFWRIAAGDACPLCHSVNGTPRNVWSVPYPLGPPSPHPSCRCWIEWVRKGEATLGFEQLG